MKKYYTVKFEILNTRDHAIDIDWSESDRYFGRIHKFAMNLTDSINNVHHGKGIYSLVSDIPINHLHDLNGFKPLINSLNLLSQGWPLCHRLRVTICIPDARSNSIIVSSDLYSIKECSFINSINQLYLNYDNKDVHTVAKDLICNDKYLELFEPEPPCMVAFYR